MFLYGGLLERKRSLMAFDHTLSQMKMMFRWPIFMNLCGIKLCRYCQEFTFNSDLWITQLANTNNISEEKNVIVLISGDLPWMTSFLLIVDFWLQFCLTHPLGLPYFAKKMPHLLLLTLWIKSKNLLFLLVCHLNQLYFYVILKDDKNNGQVINFLNWEKH